MQPKATKPASQSQFGLSEKHTHIFGLQAEEHLLPGSFQLILPGLKSLLRFLSEQLDDNLELLSDKGRDRMFISASGILEKLNVLLTLAESPSIADAQVLVSL